MTSTSCMKQQVKYKLLIVGDSGVGKTCLMLRYTDNQFKQQYLSTVGIDFKVKKIQSQSYNATLNIWDTAGQQRFRNITKSFYKGSHGIILAYSVTDLTSFQHIDSWMGQIKTSCSDYIAMVLLGCKSDLQQQRKITYEQGVSIAQKHNIPFFQVSSKINKSVNQAFITLVNNIYAKKINYGLNKNQGGGARLKVIDKEKGCC